MCIFFDFYICIYVWPTIAGKNAGNEISLTKTRNSLNSLSICSRLVQRLKFIQLFNSSDISTTNPSAGPVISKLTHLICSLL